LNRRDFVKNASIAGAAIALPGRVSASPSAATRLRPVDYVNPLIGTAPITDKETVGNNPAPGEQLYTGTVNPGALAPDPNGNLEVGPVNRYDGRGGHMMGSGYRYEDGTIMGFTHFNAEYSRNNFLLFMPTVGAIKTVAGSRPGASGNPIDGYRSAKDDSREKASAGYYTAFLTAYGTKVELTATANCGFHRYTFPASREANVLIDLANCRPSATDASVKIIGKRTIEGNQVCGRTTIYFHAVFNRDFTASGTWKNGVVTPDSASASGIPLGAYVTFNTAAGDAVLIKAGTSSISQDDAAKNLAREIPGMVFEVVHKEAETLWSAVLGRFVVEGGTDTDRTNFYSSLYRLTAGPNYGGGWMDFCAPWTARAFMRGHGLV
jgi:putative alpha-1,2-mannosidase